MTVPGTEAEKNAHRLATNNVRFRSRSRSASRDRDSAMHVFRCVVGHQPEPTSDASVRWVVAWVA